MLFHVSVSAENPRHVSNVLAEIMGGVALPFPPVSEDGWIVMIDDDKRSAIEVYPLGTLLREADGDADATSEKSGLDRFTATHAAIGTPMSRGELMAIAAREGWPAKYRKRANKFGVIELWVEGRQMFEVLTSDMQDEYLDFMTVPNWHAALAAGAPL